MIFRPKVSLGPSRRRLPAQRLRRHQTPTRLFPLAPCPATPRDAARLMLTASTRLPRLCPQIRQSPRLSPPRLRTSQSLQLPWKTPPDLPLAPSRSLPGDRSPLAVLPRPSPRRVPPIGTFISMLPTCLPLPSSL